MLPGVGGDIVGGIGQIAAGAAALIKNGIGVGAAIICVMNFVLYLLCAGQDSACNTVQGSSCGYSTNF